MAWSAGNSLASPFLLRLGRERALPAALQPVIQGEERVFLAPWAEGYFVLLPIYVAAVWFATYCTPSYARAYACACAYAYACALAYTH